jgi:hypothetical protein
MRHPLLFLSALAVSLTAGAFSASAKPARCFTTDDGHFPCNFQGLDRDGSFEISAKGVPSHTLLIEQPGVASGYIDFGARSIALPGVYVREAADPACWANSATGTRICAW